MTTKDDIINFLKELEPRGIVNCENIAAFLIPIFKWGDYLKDENKHLASEAKQFLEGLQQEGLIYLPDDAHKQLGRQTQKGYVWVNETPISGRITLGGISFLERERDREQNEKLRQSVIDTNDSVKKTNTSTQTLYDTTLPNTFKDQDNVSKWSLRLAGLSILFIAISAYLQYQDKTDQRVEELKQEVKKISKNLKELRSSLIEVNSSIQNIKTDTVFVKQE